MDFARLAEIAGAHADARSIQVAVKLGMFEALAGAPLDDAALAGALGTERRATAILANALAALGLIEKSAGRFSLKETSRR
ncbi:MAG TPA: methyltransferase dimerization domain-containing protein, partial [Candidatus Binataceae bacterium]|nr:methyltransferase dimerization domain-containing protein [Candidatus Binataceae bacterium]